METLSILTVGFILICYSVAGIAVFGRVKLILSQESSTKINYQKWYVDIAIALILAVFLPIPFILFHEMAGDYRDFRGMNFKLKRPKFDDIAWQECDTSNINTIWPGIDRKMGKYLGAL